MSVFIRERVKKVDFESCIEALAAELNLESLTLQANGTLAVAIGDHLLVTIEVMREDETALIYAEIGRAHEQDRQALYQQMLEANLFGLSTGDATLCLDDQTGKVVVYRKLPKENIEPTAFVAAWLRLVGVATTWEDRLSGRTAQDNILTSPPASDVWIGV